MTRVVATEERRRRPRPRLRALAVDERPGTYVRVTDNELRHLELILGTFVGRQSRVTVETGRWDGQRWDDELAADLYRVVTWVSARVGVEVWPGYDAERTHRWLRQFARVRAQVVNLAGRELLERHRGAQTPRQLHQIAGMVLTGAASFAAVEAARQHGVRWSTKTWVSTSTESRQSHQPLDGQTVPVDSRFANGASWPGDLALGADGTYGCGCHLVVALG